MSKRLAICVGINVYQDPAIPPLQYCVADATAIAEYLGLSEYGFSSQVILNTEGTRQRIIRQLGAVIQDPPDFLIFYFSGHGVVTDLGAYLVTHDSSAYDEGVSLEQLSSLIQRIANVVPHCLVLLDCCHSGAADFDLTHSPITTLELERGITTRTESRVLLAACRPEQVALEDSQYGHGLFTNSVLAALDGDASDSDGVVTVGSVAEAVARSFEHLGFDQLLVNKGGYAGRIVLGTGLPPRSRESLPSESRRVILGQAQQFIDDYTSQLNVSLADWKKRGYFASTQALAPTLRWFERQRDEHSELRTDAEFSSLYEAVINRVKQLAEVDTGTAINEGLIANRLGGGGFGSVWKVERPQQSPLAYKIYHPADYNLKEKRQLFSRGYRAMQRLDHPRVVKVHGYTECPVGFYMDYVDGPSLRDLSNSIEDPDNQVQFLILVAETIAHAHSRDVIHRDIKPENILATYREDDGVWLPFLTDFDLAWFSQATQVTKHAWGNLSYAAPEQLSAPRSRAAHDAGVDIYAFGQLAFFAITGTDPTPIGGADNSRALRERLAQWPSAAAAESFAGWYDKCTAPDPGDRFPDFLSTVEQLFDVESMFRDEGNVELDNETILREIAFALSGFSSSGVKAGEAFPSTSGLTNISLKVDDKSGKVDVVATLTLDRIWIETTSNERGRSILNNRIDEVLRSYVGTKRAPGTHGTFSTHIHVVGITPNREGIEFARTVVRRVLDTIEG